MRHTNKTKYTSIQISTDIAEHIREWCRNNGFVISKYTERLWKQHLSSSKESA